MRLGYIGADRNGKSCGRDESRELGDAVLALECSFDSAFDILPFEACCAAYAAKCQDETVRHGGTEQRLGRPQTAGAVELERGRGLQLRQGRRRDGDFANRSAAR